MTQSNQVKPSLKQAGASRKSVDSAAQIQTSYFSADQVLPLIIQPTTPGLDLSSWAETQRDFIDSELLKHGAILFRNFSVNSPEQFEHFIGTLYNEALKYRERSSPRHEVSGNIYTSTDYPPEHYIFLHNEHSYSATFPLRILFYCDLASQQGGETPIADCRKIYQRIDPVIRQRFIDKGWMYMRNFNDGFGLPWETVFQTSDKKAVEEYCAKAKIEVEWKSGNRLRTRQVRPAVATHPDTGEQIWFNHLTFFHITTLEPMIQELLRAQFADEDLPNNTYYGDGTPIEPEVTEALRNAYLSEQVMFPWQKGDVLLVDNMLCAHARQPFSGPRKILVGMAKPHTRTDI